MKKVFFSKDVMQPEGKKDHGVFIYTTWSDKEKAREAAHVLIKKRLVGCANILEGMESIYEWEAKIIQRQEYVMVLKSLSSKGPEIMNCIQEIHPDNAPCLSIINIDNLLPSYEEWIRSILTPNPIGNC